MKRISYVLAALATIAIAAPAIAQDKPMMKEGTHDGMHGGMHHRTHGDTGMRMHHHHHHHMMRHMMKKEGM